MKEKIKYAIIEKTRDAIPGFRGSTYSKMGVYETIKEAKKVF